MGNRPTGVASKLAAAALAGVICLGWPGLAHAETSNSTTPGRPSSAAPSVSTSSTPSAFAEPGAGQTPTTVQPDSATTTAAQPTEQAAQPAQPVEQPAQPVQPGPVDQPEVEQGAPVPNSNAEPAAAQPQQAGNSVFDAYARSHPEVGNPKGKDMQVSGGQLRNYENATLTLRAGQQRVIPISGGILTTWSSFGGVNALGLPTSGEIAARGGVYQEFEKATITWHPSAGAAVVANGIHTVWQQNGGPKGTLGLATSGEMSTPGGVIQYFQNGAISWSSAGARVIGGAINTTRRSATWLGAATTSESAFGQGAVQQFVNGTVSWHPTLGTWIISGGINSMWLANQWLGSPRSPEYQIEGGAVQFFENGAITWHPSYGAYTVGGAIGAQWLEQKHVYGHGFPMGPEEAVGEGARQRFTRGTLEWNVPQHAVGGAIGAYWHSRGGANGDFGPPTGPEVCLKHSCTQQFRNGAITWNAATGARQGELLDRRCWTGRVACADKSTNQLYWVENGKVVKTMDARFGRPGYETTEGDFPMLRKIRMDWSVPYQAWMPFSIYFTNWGEAIHYHSGFDQEGHPSLGSHGCINMASWSDAEWLFDTMRSGDRIVVYRS